MLISNFSWSYGFSFRRYGGSISGKIEWYDHAYSNGISCFSMLGGSRVSFTFLTKCHWLRVDLLLYRYYKLNVFVLIIFPDVQLRTFPSQEISLFWHSKKRSFVVPSRFLFHFVHSLLETLSQPSELTSSAACWLDSLCSVTLRFLKQGSIRLNLLWRAL